MNHIINNYENYLRQEALDYIQRAQINLLTGSNLTTFAYITELEKTILTDGTISIKLSIPRAIHAGKLINRIKLQGPNNVDCIVHDVRISKSDDDESPIDYEFRFKIQAVA